MKIFIHDEFSPETSAMLQALYSRSADSVVSHLEKVKKRGSANFMASYYVGYGHASIGDCGVTTLYIEDVSLLACKAIQDFQLYSGQETSTRYIDFSMRRLHDPCESEQSETILRGWIEFYTGITRSLVSVLQQNFPLGSDHDPAHWEKAINARAFDIARGFLPAGVTSQLAWTTNLRQAHEQVLRLQTHPLAEVRRIGEECRSVLVAKYPSSFGHVVGPDEMFYLSKTQAVEAYFNPDTFSVTGDQFECVDDVGDLETQPEIVDLLSSRPRKSQLPRTLSRLGTYRCKFLLDFGSFRDLQRHRGGLCRMPLLSSRFGFNSWYLNQLPAELRSKAGAFIESQLQSISRLGSVASEDLQYYFPMGMNVPCEVHYGLPEMVYVAELRSSQTVHPTLRKIAQDMTRFLKHRHPKLSIYADESPDLFTVRRGAQDIVDRHAK